MIQSVTRMIRSALGAMLCAMLLFACGKGREPDVGVRKPMPTLAPIRFVASPTPAPLQVAATGTTATAVATAVTTRPAEIPKDVEQVFDQMDKAFADSTARSVGIRGRLDMVSSVRSYEFEFEANMVLQFPNQADVRIVSKGRVNDRATSSAWSDFGTSSGILCDGKTVLLKKDAMLITQKAPATLDGILDEQIEIGAWGDSPIVSCFLRTKPSTAFRKNLIRARLLQSTPEQIDLELVTLPPLSIRQKNSLPDTVTITQNLTIDTRTMIPRRCYVDHAGLSREIYRRKPESQNVTVERAGLEIVVASVNLKADFSGKAYFVIPDELLSKKSAPTFIQSTIGGNPAPPPK